MTAPEPEQGTHSPGGVPARVAADTPCRHCGYNLRGLAPEGRCPECGTPIGLAVHGDLLGYADPVWVARLARGAGCMLAGLIISTVVNVFGGCVASYRVGGLPAARFVDFLGGLLGLYGAWLLTSPDPSGIGEDPHLTARRLVRAGLMVGLLQQLVIMAFCPWQSPPQWLVVLLTVVGVAVSLIWIAAEFAKFVYIERLSVRIPDPAMARSARTVRWGWAITFGVLLVGSGLVALAVRSSAPNPAGPASGWTVTLGVDRGGPGRFLPPQAVLSRQIPGQVMSVPLRVFAVALVVAGVPAFLALWLMTLSLFGRLHTRCQEQATRSRRTWAGQGPA